MDAEILQKCEGGCNPFSQKIASFETEAVGNERNASESGRATESERAWTRLVLASAACPLESVTDRSSPAFFSRRNGVVCEKKEESSVG